MENSHQKWKGTSLRFRKTNEISSLSFSNCKTRTCRESSFAVHWTKLQHVPPKTEERTKLSTWRSPEECSQIAAIMEDNCCSRRYKHSRSTRSLLAGYWNNSAALAEVRLRNCHDLYCNFRSIPQDSPAIADRWYSMRSHTRRNSFPLESNRNRSSTQGPSCKNHNHLGRWPRRIVGCWYILVGKDCLRERLLGITLARQANKEK
jgi:hypothetical protein